MWVRENAYQKGEVNTSAKHFCKWVNSDLLPNTDFPSNVPRTIKLGEQPFLGCISLVIDIRSICGRARKSRHHCPPQVVSHMLKKEV